MNYSQRSSSSEFMKLTKTEENKLSIFRKIFAIITYFIVVRPFPVCVIQFIPFY